jgi:hypothetical protein
MNPDPDPSIFIIDLQDASQQKTNLKKKFSAYNVLKALLHHFYKD